MSKRCQEINLEVFQNSHCKKCFKVTSVKKVVSSGQFRSVPKQSLQKCFKVTSVKKWCPVINSKVFQNSQCKRVTSVKKVCQVINVFRNSQGKGVSKKELLQNVAK